MHFTTERHLDGGTLERNFTLGEIPGILWTPPPTPGADGAGAPLILLGHPGGLEAMYTRLVGRAQSAAASGFATAAIELPGGGARARIAELEAARGELRRAISSGERVSDDLVDRLVLPLVERAVPEWQAALDALLALPDVGGPVGISGGVTAIAIRLATVDLRITAAGLFAGSYVPRVIVEQAKQLTIPVHILLQWDDEGNDRQQALDLFDAIGSAEKTLQANMGGHRGVPAHAGDDAARFFERHLRPSK